MAKPTAPTEAGGSKVVPLADSTATTPAAKAPASVDSAVSGEATYPVGWQGVATHRQGDALTTPGGFSATDGAGPVLLGAGLDGTTVRALAVDTSGNLQVDILNSQLAIGPTVIPGTGATNLGKAEDAAHSSGDTGVMSLGVRKDTGAAIAGTDGDYSPFQVDASGNLRVNVAAGSASGTEFNEDSPHTTGDAGPQVLGVRRDADTSPVSLDGDYHTLIFDNAGALKVNVKSSTTITESNSSSINTSLNNIELGFATEGSALNRGVLMQGDDGVDRHNIAVDASGNLQCDIVGSLPSGSNAIGKLAANTGVDIGDVTINNASGSGAVNVQDGGNSLTVDGTVTANAGTGVFDVTPASPTASSYLPVRITDGTNFGLKSSGWDTASVTVERGPSTGNTGTGDVNVLNADATKLYNVMDVEVSIFSGTTAPSGKVYLSLYHGPSASGTEFLRFYAKPIANETIHESISFVMPDRGSVNQAVVANLSSSLGANGEYSVTVHAYKTAS